MGVLTKGPYELRGEKPATDSQCHRVFLEQGREGEYRDGKDQRFQEGTRRRSFLKSKLVLGLDRRLFPFLLNIFLA